MGRLPCGMLCALPRFCKGRKCQDCTLREIREENQKQQQKRPLKRGEGGSYGKQDD